MRIAGGAEAGQVRGGSTAVVGDPVVCSIGVGGLAGVTRAEKHRDESGRLEALWMGEDVLGDVVLVVTARVVHGQEVLVPNRDLPHDLRPARLRMKLRAPAQVAREVGAGG